MEEQTKMNIRKFEVIGAILLAMVSVITLFGKPGITGFVSVETKVQSIDLSIANSQSYVLTTNQDVPVHLTSLKLSGEVIGKGLVEAYVADSQNKILIYSNIAKKETGVGSITGMGKITGNVVGVNGEAAQDDYLVIDFLENVKDELGKPGENEEITNGPFKDQCINSCFIDMSVTKDRAYQLLFYVEEGTVLNINQIVYNIKKD